MSDLKLSDYSIKYVHQRLTAEGVTFLTVELPKVSKAVISGLETGFFDRKIKDSELTSFSFKSSTLRFIAELLNKIFCVKTGVLLSDCCSLAIKAVRQLCEYSYKLALKTSQQKENEAIFKFIENERELAELSSDSKVLAFANELRKDFETYWPSISRVHPHTILSSNPPRSTNGTFVDSDEFYYLSRVSTGSRTYPGDAEGFKGFYKPYAGVSEKMHQLGFKPISEVNHSELLLVPKDSRGPRTICREALKRVETQMSYFDFMIKELSHGSNGAINFLDQRINRRIAEESSVSKRYATLDLKDASDRVSYKVISEIFRFSPGVRWFLSGSRRSQNILINGEVHPLRKLAGMGSGLTFPTMSLLISLAICHGVKKRFNLRYEDIRKEVFVYGDDICVPSAWYQTAVHHLALIGLKVNVNKSFVKGNFRESCGGDYMNGLDVTPVRLKLSNANPVVQACRLKLANNANAFKQVYEHAKEAHKNGLLNVSRRLVGALSDAHFEAFGFKMPSGAFDAESDLLVDYTKGTSHYVLNTQIEVLSVSAEHLGRVDERAFISTKTNRSYRRDPYKYLGSTLSTVDRNDPDACATALHQELINRMDPAGSLGFAELTVPRRLAFFKKKVHVDFLIDACLLTKEDWLERLRVDKFINDISALICTNVFYQAYL